MKEALGDNVEEESKVATTYDDGRNDVGASNGVDVGISGLVDDAARGQVNVERVRQRTGAAAWQRQPHNI